MNLKLDLKKVTIGVALITTLLTSVVCADSNKIIKQFKEAPEQKQTLSQFKNPMTIYLIEDGEKSRIDNKFLSEIKAINGRASVAIRDLTNAISDVSVEWDQENQLVIIDNYRKTIVFPLNKKVMFNGRKVVDIDTQATIDTNENRTFLPIRLIAEALDYIVYFDKNTSSIYLYAPGEDVSHLPKDVVYKIDSEGKYTKLMEFGEPGIVEVQPRDKVDNGNGTHTYFKGTEREYTLSSPFKKVDKTPANPNFTIVGSNKGDSRIGTYIFGPGHPIFEEGAERTIFLGGGVFGSASKNEEFIFSLVKDRQISQEKVKEFEKLLEPIGIFSEIEFDENFYDGTGILDAGIDSILKTPEYVVVFTKLDASTVHYLSTDGELYSQVPLFNDTALTNKTIIDKVIINTGSFYVVVDIPDVPIKKMYEREDWTGYTSNTVVSTMESFEELFERLEK